MHDAPARPAAPAAPPPDRRTADATCSGMRHAAVHHRRARWRKAVWMAALALVGGLGVAVLPRTAQAQDGRAAAPAFASPIVMVLTQSQRQRLAERGPGQPDGPAADRVRASLARLLQVLQLPPQAVALRLVGGNLFAEAVFGQPALAVSTAAGELPEGERLLLLAHELGHLQLAHWPALAELYRRHIPGEVRPETTDPVAGALGAQAHLLSHRHEFEADAWGYALVRRLGFGVDTAIGLLMRHGAQHDAATHPGTRRRIAQLRVLESQLAHATLHPEGSAALAAAEPADTGR